MAQAIEAAQTDRSVRASKGPTRPVIPELERLELVAALRCVDHAFVFDTDTVDPVLRALLPTFHCKGTDYTVDSVPERAVVQEYDGPLSTSPTRPYELWFTLPTDPHPDDVDAHAGPPTLLFPEP